MTDMLARERLNNNLLDQLADAQRRIAQLERSAAAIDVDGVLSLAAGVSLRVLDDAPAPPASGNIILYAQDTGSSVVLRAMDGAGVVKTMQTWT